MVLLKETGVDLAGKDAVVIGRSDIVGSPVSYLLKHQNATVTVVHSKTASLEKHVKAADVVVAAIGKPHFVKGEWLKPGAVVIDVGTNFIPDESKKSGQRLVGDVDYDSAAEVASQITPVPGGVGPMTIACLLENLVDATTRYFDKQKTRQINPLPLRIRSPPPSDIDISRSQHPNHITRIAEEVGIAASELEPYGAHKAKVDLSLLKRLSHRRNGRYIDGELDKKGDVSCMLTSACSGWHNTYTTGRGQVNDHDRSVTGTRGTPWQSHNCNSKTTESRSNVWHQGWCSRRRLLPSYTNGGVQLTHDW